MITKATSRRLTRYLAVPALALGMAIGSAGVANAEWDIGAYDACMASNPYGGGPGTEAWVEGCCDRSGGDFKSGPDVHGCFAPPAEESGRSPLSGEAPSHVIQPLPLPAPAGDIGTAPGQVG